MRLSTKTMRGNTIFGWILKWDSRIIASFSRSRNQTSVKIGQLRITWGAG